MVLEQNPRVILTKPATTSIYHPEISFIFILNLSREFNFALSIVIF